MVTTSRFLARLGVLQRLPGLSCKDIKDSNEDAATGEYWIDPTISNDEFAVFCDMQTDGGNYCIRGGERVGGNLVPGTSPPRGRRGKSPGVKVGLEGHSMQSTRRNVREERALDSRTRTSTSTRFSHRTTLSARKPASFWREKRHTVVILLRGFAKMFSCQNKSRTRKQFWHFSISKKA